MNNIKAFQPDGWTVIDDINISRKGIIIDIDQDGLARPQHPSPRRLNAGPLCLHCLSVLHEYRECINLHS